jgi:hypothetical protein
MTARKRVPFKIPPGLEAAIGAPSLLVNEDPAAYKQLRNHMIAACGIQDAMEYIWVSEIVDLTWEIQRYKRWKTALLNQVSIAGFEGQEKQKLLSERMKVMVERYKSPENEDQPVPAEWIENVKRMRERNAKAAEIKPATMVELLNAFHEKSERFERIDKLQASAEARRNQRLGEVDYYRRAFVKDVCDKADVIIDGNCAEATLVPK